MENDQNIVTAEQLKAMNEECGGVLARLTFEEKHQRAELLASLARAREHLQAARVELHQAIVRVHENRGLYNTPLARKLALICKALYADAPPPEGFASNGAVFDFEGSMVLASMPSDPGGNPAKNQPA